MRWNDRRNIGAIIVIAVAVLLWATGYTVGDIINTAFTFPG